ncbi:Collectin-12 [Mizuhopecten yessoensis]|uniref:Collectin-12 n=1 Tax=Mizuhopecten yessoensis TaxID=6573 RepID=A0A210PFU1_MIZYE|nr:Collectin-12 [Mizuhopecten yessoensis]
MNVLLMSLVFSAIMVTEVAGWGCPRGWVPFRKHCYYFSKSNEKQSWFQASFTCAAAGGALVSFNSPSELWWVKRYARRLRRGDFWLGGNDIRQEGKWVWNPTNGFPVNRDCTDWARGEPNSYRGRNQDCMLMWARKDFRWDDDECHLQRSFICERFVVNIFSGLVRLKYFW